MLDLHAHLHFPDYDADRDEVIRRAREAGVEKIVLVGTDLGTSRAAVALAEKHDFLYASVGIHPHEFNAGESRITNHESPTPPQSSPRAGEEAWVADLRELAKHPKVVAIGECGLDYFVRIHQGTTNNEQRTGDRERRTISDGQKEMQREGFLAQMDIAGELGLPMIIHTRPSAGTMDAYEDVYEILNHESRITNLPPLTLADSGAPLGQGSGDDGVKAKSYKLKAVLHCYQGDMEVTKKFLGLPDTFFSFAGSATYPVKKPVEGTKNDPREVIKLVPIERLFIETDCPYLAPQPVRGTRNEPAFVVMTAETVAGVKGIPLEELDRQLDRNLQKVFE